MTPAQCRAARALIGMTQVELAGHAVVPVSVIADFEAGTNLPRQSNVDALQKALETAGVEFIVAIVRACGPRRRSEMAPREPSTAFRRPWKLEEGDESFIVRSADGGMLAAIYFEDESGRGCPSSWRSSGRAALGSNLTKARDCRG